MRWEGLKACIQAVLTATQPAAFLCGEEREQLPRAANSAQPAKSCHRHKRQSGSRTTGEEGRERKGWKLTSSCTYATHCPHHRKAWVFSSESKLPESAKLQTLRQPSPVFSNASLVTIPAEISRPAGGLANTPAHGTASFSYIWAWAARTLGKSHFPPHPTTTSNVQNRAGGAHHNFLLPALSVRHSLSRNKGHVRSDLCFQRLSGDTSLSCHLLGLRVHPCPRAVTAALYCSLWI